MGCTRDRNHLSPEPSGGSMNLSLRRTFVAAIAICATLALSMGIATPAHAMPPKPTGSSPVSATPLKTFGSVSGQDVNSLSAFKLGGKTYIVVSGDISGHTSASGVTNSAELFLLDTSGKFIAGITGITGGYVHATHSLVTSATTATIYMVGNFTAMNGQARRGMAAYNVTLSGGTLKLSLSSWAPKLANGGLLHNGTVKSISYGQGRLYVSGYDALALSPSTAATLWQTDGGPCGVISVEYLSYTKSVYVGGLTRQVGGVEGKGTFKLSSSTGKVDKKFKPVNQSNRKVCGDKSATGSDLYSGANALDFAWDGFNKRLVECDGGIYNAVRSLNPKTGKKYWQHRLDGDAQTCTTSGKYLFVGIHRSGANVNRYTYNYGAMALVIGSHSGKQKIWQPNPEFGGGGANRDSRNNGVIASLVVDGMLIVGGAFTSPANKLAAFAVKS